MSPSRLDVRTADGLMDVYFHPPAGPGPSPTVIFFPDAGGVRATMHDMAERVARAGYFVALPNVLYRAGAFAPFDPRTLWEDPAERQRMRKILELATDAAVMRDLGALLAAMASGPAARTDRIGCMGYCMGGRLAFTAAGAYPERVAAAASIHGGHLATDAPDSPDRQANRIRGSLYFAVADNDASCTPESQAQLQAALSAAKVRYRLELYPGALHGFAVPDNPTYDEAAAEKHWEGVLALFAEALR